MQAKRLRKPTTQSNQGVEFERRDRLARQMHGQEGVERQDDRPDDGADQVDPDTDDVENEDDGVER